MQVRVVRRANEAASSVFRNYMYLGYLVFMPQITDDTTEGVLDTAAMDVKDSFVDLERHRLRLEENLVKLRQTLQHWQTWEAEYEGLKEEILAAGGKASSADLVRLSIPGHVRSGNLLILRSGSDRP